MHTNKVEPGKPIKCCGSILCLDTFDSFGSSDTFAVPCRLRGFHCRSARCWKALDDTSTHNSFTSASQKPIHRRRHLVNSFCNLARQDAPKNNGLMGRRSHRQVFIRVNYRRVSWVGMVSKPKDLELNLSVFFTLLPVLKLS